MRPEVLREVAEFVASQCGDVAIHSADVWGPEIRELCPACKTTVEKMRELCGMTEEPR